MMPVPDCRVHLFLISSAAGQLPPVIPAQGVLRSQQRAG